ncbi:putative flippase GtrA [Bacteroides zoogleoformans]|uniref:GtrA family protein n=1 Tax=Bacteroides zoogleoformans TaxID=28119 RepID=A0ABM6T985_9BACE|nr:GtrA family protein [Bacteroides zoogleoformans]AVM53371.1 GtrA family protein [Bacteroides zoogleoformans]TWJ17303.1 putative flippase GtrA [Bacteroides zoogleoformans]
MNKLKAFRNSHPEWQEKFWQVIRFGIVGTISSAIHYGVYCLLLKIVNPNFAFTGGYIVGFICNYFLTTFFTFRSHPSSANAAGFSFSHIVNYLLEIGLLNLFLWIGAGKLLAPILVMIIVVPINFLILHFVYTYRKKGKKQIPS